MDPGYGIDAVFDEHDTSSRITIGIDELSSYNTSTKYLSAISNGQKLT